MNGSRIRERGFDSHDLARISGGGYEATTLATTTTTTTTTTTRREGERPPHCSGEAIMATSERKGGERRFGWLGSGGPPRLASLIESHVVSRFKFPARKAAAEKKGVKEIGEGGRKEPKSGMSFPGSVCLVGDRGSCVDLTGVGGEARPGGRNSYLDRADARALTLLTRAASALPRSPRRSSKSARRGSRASPALPPTRLGSTSTTRTLPGSPKVGPTLPLSLVPSCAALTFLLSRPQVKARRSSS